MIGIHLVALCIIVLNIIFAVNQFKLIKQRAVEKERQAYLRGYNDAFKICNDTLMLVENFLKKSKDI